MTGITIAIVRGNCGEDVIDKSWKPERVRISIYCMNIRDYN